jgi:hypothetical protein
MSCKVDMHAVKQFPGCADVQTIMIHTHVLGTPGIAVISLSGWGSLEYTLDLFPAVTYVTLVSERDML